MSRFHSAAAVVAVFLVALPGCQRNKKINRANFDQIKPGMALSEVETLLGGPGESPDGDLSVAEGSSVGGAVGIGDYQSMTQPKSKLRSYKWGSEKRWIKVVFLEGKVASSNFKEQAGLD